MSLKPTPARLALLAAVRDGRVRRSSVWPVDYRIEDVKYRHETTTVTAQLRPMVSAGWVMLADVRTRTWELTTAGAEVLAAGTTGGAS